MSKLFKSVWIFLILLLVFPAWGRASDRSKEISAGTGTETVSFDYLMYCCAVKAWDADVVVICTCEDGTYDTLTVEMGSPERVTVPCTSIDIVRSVSTRVSVRMGAPYGRGPCPEFGSGAMGEAIDSMVTLTSLYTDSYGVLSSAGRTEVVINASADDIVNGTPKLYAVNMSGYSRLTIKCVYEGSSTKSKPYIQALLSSTSDITLATGNPVWFNASMSDSITATTGGWRLPAAPLSDLGTAIPVTNIYGNWATSDYIIIKVTAETAGTIQDFKLIAIKEQ